MSARARARARAHLAACAHTPPFGGAPQTVGSCGISGMAYATITGQPMTFLAPTGLTLAFIGALFQFTARAQVPFLPMYAWCGVWTALLLVGLSFANASGLIRYCTRFTEEVPARHRSDPPPLNSMS